MIPVSVLTFLTTQKMKDAQVLLKNKRHSAAIYLMGYALEYALKRKICSTLLFTSGFPEYRHELNGYITTLNSNPPIAANPITFTNVMEIKNHKLDKLLVYSGAEPRIKLAYFNEWSIVKDWNPENRYVRQRITNVKATAFINAANILLSQIV